MKSVFLSHNSNESELAKVFRAQLSNAFTTKLRIVSTSADCHAGEDWQEFIKKSLLDCDAAIFLLTPEYQKRPWLVAEYTAFWLAEDKKTFLLSIGDIVPDELFSTLRSQQVSKLEESASVAGFIKNLGEFILESGEEIPYASLSALSEKCQEAYRLFEINATKGKTRYKLHSTKWDFALNGDNETLSGTCTRREHFFAGDEYNQFLPVRIMQAANILQFDRSEHCELEILKDRTNGETIPERIDGNDISWRLVFNPPLRPGEEVDIEYKISIPKYKVASMEKMNEYNKKIVEESGDFSKAKSLESLTKKIDFPTEKFCYAIDFPENYQVITREPTARRYRDVINISTSDAHWKKVENSNRWAFQLEAHSPKEGTVYSITWEPPFMNKK